MNEEKHTVYEFGGFELNLAQQKLLRHGEPVPLAHKVFETLALLVQNPGRVLEKKELIQALWPESFVEEGNLSQNIFLIRKLLGDDRNGHSFIHTIPRKGYKFIASVTERETMALAPVPAVAEFWRQHSPFRSLQVFEPEDAWLFFGRDAEIRDLLFRLGRSPVLAVVGNSGSGKSSLLRAGLIPALHAARFCEENAPARANGSAGVSAVSWRVAVLRPSAALFDYLAEVLPSQLAPELSAKEQAEFIADCRSKLGGGGCALRGVIRAMVLAAIANTDKAESDSTRRPHVLLVVDQFEEIFTLTGKQEIRDRYIDGLLAAACVDGAIPVHLVLALRADFYGHCLEHAGLSRTVETNLYNVPRMTPAQMRETIEKRLQLAGARAEPGLIDALLEDAGAEPGNLALLEHALGQLWEQCGGPGRTFTNQGYAHIGRLRGALGRHADKVFENLGDDEQKRLAQKIFLALVHLGEGAQDTRRRVAKAELLALGEPEQVEKLLACLASSRLVATGREGEETFVEVSHEALIREWSALREWISQNREELALERRVLQAAEEWSDLNRDPGALLQGTRLAQGEDWLGRHQDAPDLLREYLEAGIKARAAAERKEREDQQRELRLQKATARRFRWFTYSLAVLLMLTTGSAWFAYHQRALEKSRAMAAEAEELASNDRGLAIDLAIRAWQTAKSVESRRAVARTSAEPLLTLNHDDEVGGAVFSPDGQRILSTSRDHTAKLWSASDGRLLAILRHDAQIEDAEFSDDGRRIVTASDDHTARLWDGKDGRLLAILKGHTDIVRNARFAPGGKCVVTASDDRTARIWDSADGHVVLTLAGHSDRVTDAAFSPNAQVIVTASADRTARLWNAANGRVLTTLKGHSESIESVQFSPDGQRIVTASTDFTARIWNASDGRLIAVLKHQAPVFVAAFSPDGQRVGTASFDHTSSIWNSKDGTLLATLRHEGPVTDVEFSLDGRRLVTASMDHTARVWSASGGLLAVLQGHSSDVYHAAFAPSGEQVVTGSADHTVRTWNLHSARAAILFRDNSLNVRPTFSPDGKLMSTVNDSVAKVWSIPDGHLQFELKGHLGKIWCTAFSSDGQRIVTASVDRTARVWSSHDGRLLYTLAGHTADVNSAVFSPDSQRIATASDDHTARVWSAADGHLLLILAGHTGEVISAAFSPDGQRLVTAGSDHTVRLWNSFDGRLLATLSGHTDQVYVAVFSPDGQHILSAGKDHTARLWSWDGEPLATLQGHTEEVWGVYYSPNSRYIATASLDHAARLWDADGHFLAVLGHSDTVWGAHFSPDSQRVVTASSDHTARVWSVADGRLQATLQDSGPLITAAFSSDGRHILTGCIDGSARFWEILTLDDIERILSK
ncbi:MAG TPA: winged helix-turn-helix domain-containing protein [Candidatus Angelobacter sp.]